MKSSKVSDNEILIFIGKFEKKFQQLPTHEDIMKKFKIGKIASRRALARLRKDGYFKGTVNEQKKKKPRQK